jgi:stage II sporulation protein AB (anti-sigma F factor)
MGTQTHSEPYVAGAPIADLHLPAHSGYLAFARLFVRRAAAACELDEDQAYELEYAFNEAVTNAIRHGRPDDQGLIRLSALWQGGRLTLAVHDSGTFIVPMARPADACAESGRGLALMAQFVDEVEVSNEPGATTVRLSKQRQ